MEIILKQDILKLGYKDEILVVRDGYGRNYLIPKGYAIEATSSNRKILAETLKQRAFKEDKIKNEAKTLSEKLEGISVRIGAKAGTTGKIFGSVNTIQLSEMLEKKGFNIDKKSIFIPENIKEIGTYKASIKLFKGIKVEFEFEVVSE